ncbi:hypothetical protein GCM10008965_16830 [Methylorubrum aminovorans]
MALNASCTPAARAVVVGGTAVPTVGDSSPEVAGPLDSAVTCASTLDVIAPPVVAFTETAPSPSVVVVIVDPSMRAVAVERMTLVEMTALTARAFEAEVCVPSALPRSNNEV